MFKKEKKIFLLSYFYICQKNFLEIKKLPTFLRLCISKEKFRT